MDRWVFLRPNCQLFDTKLRLCITLSFWTVGIFLQLGVKKLLALQSVVLLVENVLSFLSIVFNLLIHLCLL